MGIKPTLVEESLCRKGKRDLVSDVQAKSMKVEEEILNEKELCIEEAGSDEKKINENEEESMSAKAVGVLDEQGTLEKEDQRMLEKMIDHREKVVDEKSQKLADEEPTSFEEEEDEMLAYLWPGSGRKNAA